MKQYIFITSDIYHIGGIELYLYGKSTYLEEQGWATSVIYSRLCRGTCEIKGLQKYVGGGVLETALPPSCWTNKQVNHIIDRIVDVIGGREEEIIVESHTSTTSLWGELVAKRLGGRHFCFLCNETFIGKGKYYNQFLDFYNFKHNRKELLGIGKESVRLLFDGYKTVSEDECYAFSAMPADPIQDVECDLSKIKENDGLTFAYIGRTEKAYFPNICKGVAEYAKRNPEKFINFLIVGEIGSRREIIDTSFSEINNVGVVTLGNMVPIPRKLFAYLDLVLAGSGSALYSAYEEVPTIVADAESCKSNGLLGYDTTNYLYADEGAIVSDFCYAIERVFKERPQDHKPFILEPKKESSYYYAQQLEFVIDNNSGYIYYPENSLCFNKFECKKVLKMYMARVLNALRKNADLWWWKR